MWQGFLGDQAGVGEGRQAWGREDAAGIWKAKQRKPTELG